MLLHDPIIYWGRGRPGAPFATDPGASVSWGSALELCRQLGGALAARGLPVGTRIAVLLPNYAELLVTYYGASFAGLVAVPLNPRLAVDEWRHILADSEARVLITSSDVLGAESLVEGAPYETVWLRGTALPGSTAFADLLAAAGPAHPLPAISDGDDVLQLYTSGTTGRPKGAVFTHRAISEVLQRWQLSGLRLDPGERLYMAMPACLAAGMLTVLNSVQNGVEVVLAPEFDAVRTVEALSAGRMAATAMAPTMIQRCLAVPGASERDYPDMRWILYGAAPMPVGLLRQAMSSFGCGFYQGFGQTEASPISMLTAADHLAALAGEEKLLASVGRPQMGTNVRVLDPDGVEVALGEVGEICVQGPFVMREYWKAPELTAETQIDGWHHTGDVGYVDEGGLLFVVDRIKDTVISGGFNVYPREVERVIEQLPEVARVAVIGLPSEEWGEAVVAVVELTPGRSLTAEQITACCRADLAGYKVPKRIEFVTDFALNANGKLLKRVLREQFGSNVGAVR